MSKQLRCMHCGTPVSTEVPEKTIVRAFIECPECIDKCVEKTLLRYAVRLLGEERELWGFVKDELNALDDYNARVRHMELHDPIGRIDIFFKDSTISKILEEQKDE